MFLRNLGKLIGAYPVNGSGISIALQCVGRRNFSRFCGGKMVNSTMSSRYGKADGCRKVATGIQVFDKKAFHGGYVVLDKEIEKPVFASDSPSSTSSASSASPSSASSETIEHLSAAEQAPQDVKQTDQDLGESDDTASTGVIEKSNRETLLYFTNLSLLDLSQYPRLKFAQDYLNVLTSKSASLKSDIMKLASPESSPIPGISINSIISKDGGAFVKFQIPYDSSVTETNIAIQKNTSEAKKPWWSFNKPQCFPVKGTPWVEDLRRYPTNVLKVSFDGEDLTEEVLYQLFRRYGKILDIVPQPSDSKETPRYATIRFWKTRSAIAAKNCVNALTIENTTLHIKYQKIVKESFLKEMLFSHTRISIPILLALFLALGSIIFEPIREFFIQEKIEKRFTLENFKDNQLYRYALQGLNLFKRFIFRSAEGINYLQTNQMWTDKLDKIQELKLWLTENVNTFIVVRGQKGAGKEELVLSYALEDRKDVLVIDCESIVKSRNDSEFLKNVARQFGYFPIFPWLNSLSIFIDLGVQGLTGQKSGLSESCEVQFKNILSLSVMAIRKVSLRFYSAFLRQIQEADQTADKESSLRITEDDYLQQHPEEKPVIVINKFAAKSENYSFIYSSIANWAAFLVSMNLAHVIFLVDDVSPIPVLTEALPGSVFKNSVLSDASKSSSAEYVFNHLNGVDALDAVKDEDEKTEKPVKRYSYSSIEKALDPIGGRMLDLQAFIRRVKSGETPEQAQKEMVLQAAEQIVQMNLATNSSDELEVARSWELIKQLAAKESIPFAKIYTKPLFKASPVKYLTDLEKANLITLVKEKGIIKEIKASKPLYRSAFQNIVEDPKVFNVLETEYLIRKIGYETKVIKGCEEEVSKLSFVANADTIKSRFEYLGAKITASTENIIKNEQEIKRIVESSTTKKSSWF